MPLSVLGQGAQGQGSGTVVGASPSSAASSSRGAIKRTSAAASAAVTPMASTRSSSSSNATHGGSAAAAGTGTGTGTGSSSSSLRPGVSALDQAMAVLADKKPTTQHEDMAYHLHPRLAYSSRELGPSSFVFLNERTLLFPVGLQLFKFDVGAQSIAAAASAAAAAANATTTAGGTPLLPDAHSGGVSTAALVAAPLAGVGVSAPEYGAGAGAGAAATGCMEFFFKRSYAVAPTIAIARNRSRLAIAEDMETYPGSAAAAAQASHSRGGGGAAPSGAYKKALISIIDLTCDPPVLCWQFHHHHAGRVASVDFSANGSLIAVAVELDQSDAAANTTAGARQGSAGSSVPTPVAGSQTGGAARRRRVANSAHVHSLTEEPMDALAGGNEPDDAWAEEGEGGAGGATDDGAASSSRAGGSGVSGSSSSSSAYKAISAVTVWRVDTHKYLSSHPSDHSIHALALNPDDAYLMVAAGGKYIRYLKTVGAQLDEVAFLKRLLERTYTFRAAVWVDGAVLAALSEESEVLIFQRGSLKQVISHQFTPVTDKLLSIVAYREGFFCGSQEGTLIQVIPAKQAGGGPAVAAAAAAAAAAAGAGTADGAGAAAGSNGASGKDGSKSTSSLVDSSSSTSASQSTKLFKVNNEFATHKGALQHMVVSPNDGLLVVSVRDHGLATFPMDLMGKWAEFETEPELSDILMPSGDVIAMDACEQRSIVATASSDHTVSIWSHMLTSPRASPCAIRHTFNEMPLAVAFHPAGFQMLIGFATHIGLFHLLRHSIKLSYSFQLYTRTVTPLLIRYSHGGDRFAVATGVHIFIYSALDFRLIVHIPGNTGLINALEWSSDDGVILSANGEGAIYGWEVGRTLRRVVEHVEKGVEFHAMCVDWGKQWAKHSYNALHHAKSGAAGGGGGAAGAGVAGAAGAVMTADALADSPTASSSSSSSSTDHSHAHLSSSEKRQAGRLPESHPLYERAQVLAAGATFTSYRLKSVSMAAGAQDVRARDYSPTSASIAAGVGIGGGGAAATAGGEELALDRISITHLIRDAQRNLIIAGTSTGYVLLLRWPFQSVQRDVIDIGLAAQQSAGSGAAGGGGSGGTGGSGAGGGVGSGSGGASSHFDALHAKVLGKFLIHEGAVLQLLYLPLSGVLVSYGADGNLFVHDLRMIDLRNLLSSPAGQVLARQSAAGAATGAAERSKLLRLGGGGGTGGAGGASGGIGTDDKAQRILSALSLLAAHAKAYKAHKLTPVLLPKSVSNARADWQSHLYSGDSDLVLVRNSEYEAILREIRENSQDVQRMERTAEYQMSAQKDFYIQNLKSLRGEMEALLKARETELATTKSMLSLSENEKSAAATQHKLDVAELNTNWRATLEKKLHESYVAMEKKVAEIAALKSEAAATQNEMAAQAAAALASAHSEAATRESALQTRISELELALRESESAYEEAMAQMENEHDNQVVGLERSSALARAKTREGTAILQAEVSAAKRKLEEKNESWKSLEALSNEREDQLHHLASVIRKLTSEMTLLKQQLREKEEHITRRQHELAQARQDNGTLKNFLQILEHRIAELENRETPALDTMIALKAQVESMSDELFELNKAKLAAQNLAVQKQGESTRFSITANNLRHKLAKREHAWESVQKELKYIVEHSGHGHGAAAHKALMAGSGGGGGTAGSGASGSTSSSSSSGSGVVNLHVDLKNLYTNYFANRSSAEPEQPDRSLIEKVENEATRQRNFLEKSLRRLRNANAALGLRTKADGEKALAQNINFLHEVNRLREENSRLFSRCGLYRSMVVQAGLGKKLDMIDSGDEGAALMQIEEEHRAHAEKAQAEREKQRGGKAGNNPARRSIMPPMAEEEEDAANETGNHAYGYLPSPAQQQQQQQQQAQQGSNRKALQSAGDAMQPPAALLGLASHSLGNSQSSATLPSVPQARGMRDSHSTPALLGYDTGSSGSDYFASSLEFANRPATSSSSGSQRGGGGGGSAAGPRGRDAISIEGGAARAARERHQQLQEEEQHAQRGSGRGTLSSGGGGKGRVSSPSRGSNKALLENSQLKVRAADLERRLEQVNQHVSLQQVHISALQTAIKHTAADAAQARQSAREEQMLGYASDEFDDAGAEDDNAASSSAHFFPSPSASAKKREGRGAAAPGSAPRPSSGSRGRLSPLRKGMDRSESPPSTAAAGAMGLAGQPLRGAGHGHAAHATPVRTASGVAKAPSGGALSPLDRSASSGQLHADGAGASDSQRSNKSSSRGGGGGGGGGGGLAAALDAALANSRAKAQR